MDLEDKAEYLVSFKGMEDIKFIFTYRKKYGLMIHKDGGGHPPKDFIIHQKIDNEKKQ